MAQSKKKTRKYVVPVMLVAGAALIGTCFQGCRTRQPVVEDVYGPPVDQVVTDPQPNGPQDGEVQHPQTPQPPIHHTKYGPPVRSNLPVTK